MRDNKYGNYQDYIKEIRPLTSIIILEEGACPVT